MIIKPPKQKPKHYWAIHRKVTMRAWRNISPQMADVVAADVEGKTSEAREFAAHVSSETERLFNDPNYYANSYDTFKYPSR